jgi:hypothetical protein
LVQLARARFICVATQRSARLYACASPPPHNYQADISVEINTAAANAQHEHHQKTNAIPTPTPMPKFFADVETDCHWISNLIPADFRDEIARLYLTR